ncbi:MAG TPA: HEAT repeat domain-containing protein [Vicinamibacterales bacterium]|nr:HEAT repeat domain-containing protein [Vicinamibacterales bacterium]
MGLLLTALLLASLQSPGAAPAAAKAPTLSEAIDQLGSIEYDVRTRASRTVRRAAPAEAVPALTAAVERHDDGYVRYRALVLLSAFNHRITPDVMRQAMLDPNDRLRTVAYAWFERHPDPEVVSTLLDRLEHETSEFVRPALIRAMAAAAADPRVQTVLLREVNRGEDFFRSAVIDALGRHKAAYAIDALAAVAKLEGPLQDDAALALGRIGGRRGLPVLAALQRTAPREVQPAIAAGICLLGQNCAAHRNFLVRTLTFAEETIGFQELLRGAASGLGAIAETGDRDAMVALIETGIPSTDPARAPIALALASAAVANPAFLLDTLENRADLADALTLLMEGFDMLEEDFAEEQFFAAVRRAYWAAPEGSPRRRLVEAIVTRLDF